MRAEVAYVSGKMVEGLIIRAKYEMKKERMIKPRKDRFKTEISRVSTKSYLKYEKSKYRK